MSVRNVVEIKFQDVLDDLDYTFDYGIAPCLIPGETIVTSTWSVTPSGLTLHDVSHTNTKAIVWAKDGTEGATYLLVNKIVTSNTPPRTINRSFELHIYTK